ncbi:MAG: indole-3-glycerol-phosphate synthase [Pseudomonadota bacterium]
MADFLAQMAESSQARVAKAMSERDLDRLVRLVDSASLPPRLVLSDGFDVIAEVKGHSPAEGELADEASLDRVDLANQYADGGAMAVSVLSEPTRFAGNLAHVATVARTLAERQVPVMRKDFLVSPYQIYEARLSGAGGVLLITAMLDDAQLEAMLLTAASLSLFVLLECFDEADIERSAALLGHPTAIDMIDAGQLLLGVNTRNLRTLAVDTHRLANLAPRLPTGVITVAESGLKTASDAARVAELGYRAGLVGTALMRSDDPKGLIRAMREAAN